MDGIDIYSIRDEWTHIIGYVPQVVFMTDDTIRKNIAFGIADEEISDDRVMEAIESLQGIKILIIVAHRLSTIQNCDKVYEIGNGVATVVNRK